jgi:hypothetical protein
MHFVVITAAKSNVKSLVSLLEYFKFSKLEKARYLEAFKNNKDKFAHFCLDINERTVSLIGSGNKKMNSLVDISSTDDRSLALTMLAEVNNPGKATAIYHLVARNLPAKRLNEADLTVTLKSAKLGKKVIVSLVEYLDCVTTPGQKPDPVLLSFHKFIQRLVHIPRCFILNAAFLK